MNLNDAEKRIQKYLDSTKSWPLLVDMQTKQSLSEITDFFKVGENCFLNIEKFCNEDGILKLDEFYSALSCNIGNTFITGLTGFLKIQGTTVTKKTLKNLATIGISGHVVIFTYQCKEYLKFSDPRILESGRLIVINEEPDSVTDFCFIAPELATVFPDSYFGIQKIGYIVENSSNETTYITTSVSKDFFNETLFHIAQLNNSYELLKIKDPRIGALPENSGSPEQWNYVLRIMGREGDWEAVIKENFGSESNLVQELAYYQHFDENKKWLYCQALSLCESINNSYLQLAFSSVSGPEELVKAVYRAILAVDKTDKRFHAFYKERKTIISDLKDTIPEVLGFCKVLSAKGEDAIYYLTDVTQPEKERVITWLDTYGEKYNTEELKSILKNVYPDLSKYLTTHRFKNVILDSYFEAYKYQKVINRILPSFETQVDEQAIKKDFVTLKSRSAVVEKLDISNAKAFFVDAMGVEYLGYIQEKCNDYGLSTDISYAKCELPTLTCFNKEFVATLAEKGCLVTDIKKLDEIKHRGEENSDYEKENPVYLINELQIIENLLNKIRSDIFTGKYEKAVIVSDHGTSRMAVLYDNGKVWSMTEQGEHSGRCCKISDKDQKPETAIEENGYWVMTNYDRFKGGRRASCEVHGGATLEEVTVPIIEVTQKKTDIEAFIIDKSKKIILSAMEHAVINIYVGVKSNNIAIKLDNKYYDAIQTAEQFIYKVDLPNYTKKGTFMFDIIKGNDVIALGQRFEIKKKGLSENSMFD